jgi:hypothetical protein
MATGGQIRDVYNRMDLSTAKGSGESEKNEAARDGAGDEATSASPVAKAITIL